MFITSNYIINSFYTNHYLFLIESSVVILIVGLILFYKSNIAISKMALLTIIFVALWIIYIFLNDYFINPNGEKTKSTYLIVSLILYIAFAFIFSENKSITKNTFVLIAILVAIECIYCILQFFEIIQTNESLIKVTGSWINPNITAMFLTLTLPFVLLNVLNKHAKYRKLFVTLFVLIVISLIFLKCRSAILGSILAAALVLEWQYKTCQNFIGKSSKKNILTTILLLVFSITVIGCFAYYIKKDSADGRKLIWRLSLKMVAEKPFFGYGYGGFERNYNLEQANYFSNNISTENEKTNASHTDMAYNEIIENAVEGGIIGSTLFIVFFALVLINGKLFLKFNNYAISNNSIKTTLEFQNIDIETKIIVSSIIGLIVFLFMSLVNFSITSVPIMFF